MHCVKNLLFFDTPLLYCYNNFNSSIICCISSGDMYLFLGVALSTFTSVSLFCNSFVDFFKTLIIMSAILLPILLTCQHMQAYSLLLLSFSFLLPTNFLKSVLLHDSLVLKLIYFFFYQLLLV